MITDIKTVTRPQISTIELADLLAPFGVPKDKLEFLNFLMTRKGQYMACRWTRTLKTLKHINDTVVKKTAAVCRAGISYDNIADVVEKRIQGELPAEPQPLAWGEWLAYPYIIRHQPKGAPTPELYVRLYPSKNPQHGMVKVQYYLNGVETTREKVEPICLASEFRETSELDCFTLKLQHVNAEPLT